MLTAKLVFLLLPTMAAARAVAPDQMANPHLAGVINFRDVGGIPTADGHVVRHGMIFRSAELSGLTQEDFQSIGTLHIRYIFDLRTDQERALAATHWTVEAPTVLPISVGFAATAPPSSQMASLFGHGTDPAHVNEAMRNLTVQLVINGAPAIGTVLHDLASGDEPAIIHCTAGKDRTGVVTAVLLRILGASMESIYSDYLRSNEAVPAELAHMKAAASAAPSNTASPLSALPTDSLKILMGVDRSYLEAAFAAIDDKYGSFENFVSKGLLLTPADVESLRSRLLEPAGNAFVRKP